MTDYYRVNGQALSYAEYWRMSPDPVSFAIAALRKLLRIPIFFSSSIPRVDSLFFVEPEEIPARVRRRWRPAIEACQDQDLQVQFCYTLPTLETDRESYAASFLSADGLVAANLVNVRMPAREVTAFACLSRLKDGREFITSDQPKQMEPHPDDEIVRLPGSSADEVLELHLDSLGPPGRIPVRLDDDFEKFVLRREQRHVDYHIVRGVYVRMTEEEIDRLRAARRRACRDEEP